VLAGVFRRTATSTARVSCTSSRSSTRGARRGLRPRRRHRPFATPGGTRPGGGGASRFLSEASRFRTSSSSLRAAASGPHGHVPSRGAEFALYSGNIIAMIIDIRQQSGRIGRSERRGEASRGAPAGEVEGFPGAVLRPRSRWPMNDPHTRFRCRYCGDLVDPGGPQRRLRRPACEVTIIQRRGRTTVEVITSTAPACRSSGTTTSARLTES